LLGCFIFCGIECDFTFWTCVNVTGSLWARRFCELDYSIWDHSLYHIKIIQSMRKCSFIWCQKLLILILLQTESTKDTQNEIWFSLTGNKWEWHDFCTILKKAYPSFASHSDCLSWLFLQLAMAWWQLDLNSKNGLGHDFYTIQKKTYSSFASHSDCLSWLFLQLAMAWWQLDLNSKNGLGHVFYIIQKKT